MSELTLLILRLVFLAVLWGFVFAIVYSLRSDLFGPRVRRQPVEAAVATFPDGPRPDVAPQQRGPTPANALRNQTTQSATATTASRLVITGGPKEGVEVPLGSQPLTIGRSNESGLVIRDDYTSTHHARIMLLNDSWVVQDLDSTNGTFLDGVRVLVPTQIPLNTPVKIGTTSFELRR